MKLRFIKVIILFVLYLIFGCSNPAIFSEKEQKRGEPTKDKNDEEIKIEFKEIKEGGIISYQAEVTEYTYNTRIAGSIRITPTYKLSIKESNSNMNVRIDYPKEYDSAGIAKSIFANKNDVIIMNTLTKEIIIKFQREDMNFNSVLSNSNPFFGKVNVEKIVEEIENYSQSVEGVFYNIIDDETSDIVTVEIPSEDETMRIIKENMNGSDDKISSISGKIFLDKEKDVLVGNEMAIIKEDGTKEKIATTYNYKEYKGEQILVEEKVEIHTDYPYTIDTSDSILPRVDNQESIPVITEEELKRIKENDGMVCEFEQIVGDPSDPDNTQVYVRKYNNIKINIVNDNYFIPGK